MKKFAYILLASTVILTACNRDEGNLFDKSAAERLEAAQTELYNTLVAHPEGWEMHYFPSAEKAGYAFIMQFRENKNVTIYAKNKVTTGGQYRQETSMWDTDGTQGAVLTFNSYNSLFHEFADPGSDGLGYEGDYEFVILETTDAMIRLKGKKHGAYVYMYPLSSEYSNYAKYFEAIDNFGNKTTYYNDGAEMLLQDPVGLDSITLEDGYFTRDLKKTGDLTDYGYIVLPGKLRFYTGMTYDYGTKVARDFVLNADESALVNTDNQDVRILPNFTPAQFYYRKITKSNNRWIIRIHDCDPMTQDAWQVLYTQLESKGAKVQTVAYENFTITIKNEITGKTTTTVYNSLYFGYTVQGHFYEGRIPLTIKTDAETIEYANEEIYDAVGGNIIPLLERLNAPSLDEAALQLSAPFVGLFNVERYSSSLNMTRIRFKQGGKELILMIDGDLK